MPTYIIEATWTDQGSRTIKELPKRIQGVRDTAKKVGVEIKHIYVTTGDQDLMYIVDSASGDNVAKFALSVGALGNIKTRTLRAWSESEFQKIVSELP
jgi:uncharacterized protein with GYD domain